MNKRILCRVFTLIYVLTYATAAYSAAPRLDLNGEWQFALDASEQGERAGWTKSLPAATETVHVPHTWNTGKHEDYEGTAWYFRKFTMPETMSSTKVGSQKPHVELHFGATFYTARIWLNGTLVGTHDGGHSAYYFDVTPILRAENFLAVEINNQPTAATIPGLSLKLVGNLWYDWWHYGGIVRDVWLTTNDETLVRRQQIDTKVEGTTARVSNRVFLENHGGKTQNAKLVLDVFDSAGGAMPVATAEKNITLKPGKQDEVLTLDINRVKLWHFDRPQVYRMEARLITANGASVDSITDNFGARTVEIKNRGLYLNGERVRLTGMTRHQESITEGLAETTGTMRRDYDDLKELHVTLTRPVHYQQHDYILDYADRNGIMLIPEIPVWQFNETQLKDARVQKLAAQLMREMIEQNYNHPAIFAWSVCNESATNTPGGVAYFRMMRDLVKSINPNRFVTFADEANNQQKPTVSVEADFVMMNQYYGAWHGGAEQLAPTLERINRHNPERIGS